MSYIQLINYASIDLSNFSMMTKNYIPTKKIDLPIPSNNGQTILILHILWSELMNS